MGIRNTATDFGVLAKALHWLAAIGIFTLIYLGLEQASLPRGDEKSSLRFLHASVATATLAVMSLRIIWRFMNEVPGHPTGMAAWQRISASVVHWGLYIFVFAQLTAGVFVVGTGGRGLPFFGLFQIPLPIAEDHDSHEWWEGVHEFLWIPLAILLGIHVLGALYNHFIARNDVLRRMTTGVK